MGLNGEPREVRKSGGARAELAEVKARRKLAMKQASASARAVQATRAAVPTLSLDKQLARLLRFAHDRDVKAGWVSTSTHAVMVVRHCHAGWAISLPHNSVEPKALQAQVRRRCQCVGTPHCFVPSRRRGSLTAVEARIYCAQSLVTTSRFLLHALRHPDGLRVTASIPREVCVGTRIMRVESPTPGLSAKLGPAGLPDLARQLDWHRQRREEE